LNGSDVVDARATSILIHSHIGICQAATPATIALAVDTNQPIAPRSTIHDIVTRQLAVPSQMAAAGIQAASTAHAPRSKDAPPVSNEIHLLNEIDQPGGAATVAKKLGDAHRRNSKAQLLPEDVVNFVGSWTLIRPVPRSAAAPSGSAPRAS
jgi:hypothetical protein